MCVSRGSGGGEVYFTGLGSLLSVGVPSREAPAILTFPSGTFLGQWAVSWYDHDYNLVYSDSFNSWLLLSRRNWMGPHAWLHISWIAESVTSSCSDMSYDCVCDCLFVSDCMILGFRKCFENPLCYVLCALYIWFSVLTPLYFLCYALGCTWRSRHGVWLRSGVLGTSVLDPGWSLRVV